MPSRTWQAVVLCCAFLTADWSSFLAYPFQPRTTPRFSGAGRQSTFWRHTTTGGDTLAGRRPARLLFSGLSGIPDDVESESTAVASPQVFASGHSTNPNLTEALREAATMALAALPQASSANDSVVDLALVSVSSLYDGGSDPPALIVVDAVVDAIASGGRTLRHLIGSSVSGCIGSTARTAEPAVGSPTEERQTSAACVPVEWEGIPAVSVTLALLPDSRIRTFHVSDADVPDDYGRLPADQWKRAVGLDGWTTNEVGDEDGGSGGSDGGGVFWLLPSPAFSTELDDLLQGLSVYFPGSCIIGGIASTVSSLSRAKLYRYSADQKRAPSCMTDGCVGVALAGDVQVQALTAQGAKPVGGIYQIVKGKDSTIQVIVLDETATEQLNGEDNCDYEEEEDTDEEETEMGDGDDRTQQAIDAQERARAYAKARIPKPVLAEANFLMRTLSDDDQAFMRRKLLVGLDRGGSIGRTASELARLARGEGHRFTVHQVASAGMKDGSITLPLGSVDVSPGTRLRFFVRESDFAKREVEALWLGYKKRLLSEQFRDQDSSSSSSSSSPPFTPTACLMVPTLDRGGKFFLGSAGYESGAVAEILPSLPCISGFFCNGVIGPMDDVEGARTGVLGSASGYFLIGSRTGRPLYSPAEAAAEREALRERKEAEEAAERALAAEDEMRRRSAAGSTLAESSSNQKRAAPRSEDGELILKRREVHSGRALTVSTVEWSVAEKTATPSSALEGFMWDKETEVDRYRERVPLANLLSQCRLSASDPASPKPRDFVGPLKRALRGLEAGDGGLVIVPECKRTEPVTGSLRRRYDLPGLVRDFTLAGAPAIAVNCDGVLFGGSTQDISEARRAASAAAVEASDDAEDGVVVPPILASDLILYPYQLYGLRLAGADAVNLVAGALAGKDLMYLTKIASSLKLQVLVTANSEAQLRALAALSPGSIDGVILSNRELEDFTFDMSGERALRLLRSKVLEEVRNRQGDDLPVLVEGRVGLIERTNDKGKSSASHYLKELREAGAMAAVVGGGLVSAELDTLEALKTLQQGSS